MPLRFVPPFRYPSLFHSSFRCPPFPPSSSSSLPSSPVLAGGRPCWRNARIPANPFPRIPPGNTPPARCCIGSFMPSLPPPLFNSSFRCPPFPPSSSPVLAGGRHCWRNARIPANRSPSIPPGQIPRPLLHRFVPSFPFPSSV